MTKLEEILDRLPVATLVHLIVTVVLGVDLIVNGGLSDDALTYAAIVEGGNGLLGIARGSVKSAKVNAAAALGVAPEVR